MRKVFIICFLVLQLMPFLNAENNEINTQYTPTKREWLDIQLNQEYNKFILRENTKCEIDFTILTNYVDIYVNLGKDVSQKSEEKMKAVITDMTHKILDKYSWSKDFFVRIKISKE
ncbi:MAG: hypothetical protein NT145_02205 [Elusimicrobia bacterium]|nr:hypothetical protein [Elusimicrobiota bacterium]